MGKNTVISFNVCAITHLLHAIIGWVYSKNFYTFTKNHRHFITTVYNSLDNGNKWDLLKKNTVKKRMDYRDTVNNIVMAWYSVRWLLDHFYRYINVEWLWCTPETNTVYFNKNLLKNHHQVLFCHYLSGFCQDP